MRYMRYMIMIHMIHNDIIKIYDDIMISCIENSLFLN